jgi:heme/copper-type cytochrome/quinol oxidase subunit 4
MSEIINYNPETVKTVLNILQKEYDSEEGRIRHITSKVQMMLAVAGIMLTIITFLLKTGVDQNWNMKLISMLLFIAFLAIIIAIDFFLDVLMVKTYKRIKFEAIVFSSELKKEPAEVEGRLIATYEEALKANIQTGDAMIKFYRWGTFLIIISLTLTCIVLSIVFIYQTFDGGKL